MRPAELSAHVVNSYYHWRYPKQQQRVRDSRILLSHGAQKQILMYMNNNIKQALIVLDH